MYTKEELSRGTRSAILYCCLLDPASKFVSMFCWYCNQTLTLQGLRVNTYDDVDEDLSVTVSSADETGIHMVDSVLLSTFQGSSRQGNLLPIWEEAGDPPETVDQDDMMALNWHSGGEDETREEDDDDDSILFDLYDKASPDPHIASPCFSHPAETAQSILNPTAPFDYGSDSDRGLSDALAIQSHDIPNRPFLTLPQCRPLFSNTANAVTLLAGPACEIDTLSYEHEAGLLTTQLSQGRRQSYICFDEMSSKVDGVAGLDLQLEDSDMDVLDFDWQENADGLYSVLEGSLTPDPFSQGSSGCQSSAGSPFTDGQVRLRN